LHESNFNATITVVSLRGCVSYKGQQGVHPMAVIPVSPGGSGLHDKVTAMLDTLSNQFPSYGEVANVRDHCTHACISTPRDGLHRYLLIYRAKVISDAGEWARH
jgi:hypothetical protein